MSDKRRSLTNLVVQPRYQLKLALFYMVVGGLMIGGIGIVVLQKLDAVQNLMNNPADMSFAAQLQVNELMRECVQIAMAGFAVFVLFSFVFAVVTSHRVAGPQVAIKAFIDALKRGDYDYQRNLRPRDELTEIMDGLKDLAVVLKERERDKS